MGHQTAIQPLIQQRLVGHHAYSKWAPFWPRSTDKKTDYLIQDDNYHETAPYYFRTDTWGIEFTLKDPDAEDPRLTVVRPS